MEEMQLRAMVPEDWPSVSKIYVDGMATGYATFEQQTPTYEAWDKAHLGHCRIVAIEKEKCLGWAALSPVSSRCVYGGVGEVSIYISAEARGKGIGSKLMQALIMQSEENGLWTLQSGIFPENKGSIRLHEKMGFRYIGKRERIGKKDGLWKDNPLFERRSTVVGVD